MTTFLIEAVVLCALFHLEVWLQTKREPARIVYSYPPAIVERYIELGKIPDKKNPSTLERVKRKRAACRFADGCIAFPLQERSLYDCLSTAKKSLIFFSKYD